jgi:hypothetical protein
MLDSRLSGSKLDLFYFLGVVEASRLVNCFSRTSLVDEIFFSNRDVTYKK